MNENMRDYIARSRAAQQKYDERPGTQLGLLAELDLEVATDIADFFGVPFNPNHDDDPGDCTDHRGS